MRLHIVFGYVRAIADVTGNTEFEKKLVELSDHKGELTVTWNTEPTEDEKRYFAKAWERVCELAENICHNLVAVESIA